MIWLLLALVTFADAPSPDLKIHDGLRFDTFEECNRYRATYEKDLTKALKRAFPNISNSTIRCFNNIDAEKMRQHMQQRYN